MGTTLLTLALAANFLVGYSASQDPATPVPSARQIKHDRQIGHGFKHGERLPGEVQLGERTWTPEGKIASIVTVTSNEVGELSSEKTSYVVGLLRSKPARHTTLYKYDANGLLSEEITTAFSEVYRTIYRYDEHKHLISAVHYDGSKPCGERAMIYDVLDSVVSISEYDRKHELLTVDSFTYDANHRRTAEIRSNYGVGSRLRSQTSRLYRYDDAGRLIEERTTSQGIPGSSKVYSYEGSSTLPISCKDGDAGWLYEYDARGHVIKETETFADDPRGYRRFEYDESGNLLRESTYNGRDELLDEIVHNIAYW